MPSTRQPEQIEGFSLDMKQVGMSVHEDLVKAKKWMIVPFKAEDEEAYLDEYYSTPTSTGVIQFRLQVDRPALIKHILYSFSPLGAATLQIGDRMIPIPSTTVKPPDTLDVEMIIKPGDLFTLTAAGATSMFIEVMGKVLSGTNWSQV